MYVDIPQSGCQRLYVLLFWVTCNVVILITGLFTFISVLLDYLKLLLLLAVYADESVLYIKCLPWYKQLVLFFLPLYKSLIQDPSGPTKAPKRSLDRYSMFWGVLHYYLMISLKNVPIMPEIKTLNWLRNYVNIILKDINHLGGGVCTYSPTHMQYIYDIYQQARSKYITATAISHICQYLDEHTCISMMVLCK